MGDFIRQKTLINNIAAEYTQISGTRAARQIQSMLNELSVENYSDAAHFVLELIQNADDASYTRIRPPSVPSLTFKVVEGRVDVVCNEDGFTDEDVQALCDVCQSTKNTTDAIGRKGLGFKSVFKACHLVHIGSNGFQFCFDGDDGDFGKVKPTWRVYPEWLRDPQKTYMSLKLSAREDPSDIRRGIQTLEPSVLLFLRNLERITIQTPGFHKLMTCKDRGQEVTTITTETWEEDGESACESMEYVMVRASSGFSTPQLILAFPCPNDGGSEPQQVHTFLPIRSYGFKFIIQADFQLTSSRESIDESSKRNGVIKDALPAAFLAAVQLFNASKIKSSTWIQYLPGRSDLQGFFATIDLDGYLSDKAVLFSQEGRLAVPSDLIYVPEEFRLSKSQFVPLSFPGRCILSLRYDRCDITVLKRLGVRQLDIRFFFTALRVLADAAWPNVDWHDKLAKMLLEFHTDTLADVPLIPVELCGHIKWIKAKDLEKSPIYFQEGLEDHQVADGTNLLFVPLEASLNHHRRLLLKKLGVGRLAKKAICEAVQQSLQRSSSPILVGTAVSLTKYLFRHREIHPRPEIKYWSAALSVLEAIFGGAHLWKCAHDLYFDDPRESPHTITQFLPALSSRGCLHPDYLQEDPRLNKEDWMDWLIEQGISVFPRPIDEKLSSYKPSEHFISFVKQATDKSLCEVLLRHWKSYEPYLRVIEGSLKERLGRRIVPTKSLRSIALEFRVALPWDRFLDMDDPNNHAGYYDTLKQFGLITELNAHFYLEMLRYHQKQGDAHPKMPRLIHRIYDSLQHCSDVDQTRFAFKNEPLIAMDLQGTYSPGMRWFSSGECFWSHLDCLSFNSGLSVPYGNCENLFRILDISSVATMEHITTDLSHLARTGDTEFVKKHVKPIIIKLSTLIRRAKADRSPSSSASRSPFSSLKKYVEKLKIWPIVTDGSSASKLVSSQEFTSGSRLFVPDRADLYEMFQGKVPLLDFTYTEVYEIQPFIEWFPSAQLLSKEVQKNLSYNGRPTLQETMTNGYRERHEGVLRCVRHYLPRIGAEVGGQLHRKLKNLEVYEVETVDCAQWIGEKPPGRGSGNGSYDRAGWPKGALAAVRTAGDVVLRQSQEKFTIYKTSDRSLRKKARYHSIPERLAAELGLPTEATRAIASILELSPSISSGILDEDGIARLPTEPVMPQDRDGNAACTTPEKLLDQGMFASQARRDTSELLATSTSVGSPFPGTNRESKDGANTSIFGSPLVFRPRDQPATGSAPPDSGSRPNQDSAPVTPNTSNKAAAVRSKVSLPRPAHALPPTLPTNSGPTVTNIRAESLIGPTELQEAIISSAKELGSFPRSVPCVHSTNSIPKPSRMSDEPLMDLSPSTIGYLGELFAVSFLNSMLRPNFDPSVNWTSKLRKRARYCIGFEKVTPYKETEISDIRVKDTQGIISRWLHCLGYRPAKAWAGRSVTYYVEVKTTIRDSSAPFKMSVGQMEHAQRWIRKSQASPDQEALSCYLIFRVYRILEDCRHMCVYVDPYTLMRDGVLEASSVLQYSVVPARPDTDETMIEGQAKAERESDGEKEVYMVSEHGLECGSQEETVTESEDGTESDTDGSDGDYIASEDGEETVTEDGDKHSVLSGDELESGSEWETDDSE